MSTFSQIYIHIVFAVKHRAALIEPSWEDYLYQYITGIVKNKGQILIAINGMPDHIHFLIAMKPTCCLSDLVREVKKATNEIIKARKFTKFKFNWQEGFGAFSYSRSHLNNVVNYIKNQKEHHSKQNFRLEYLNLLDQYEIPYDQKYMFDWINLSSNNSKENE